MTLQRLSCLVLTLVLGTAMSVRWYLDAEEAVQAAPPEESGAIVYQHVPLPMRAEPARFRWVRAGATGGADAPCLDSSRPVGASQPTLAPLVRSPAAGARVPTAASPSAYDPAAGSF